MQEYISLKVIELGRGEGACCMEVCSSLLNGSQILLSSHVCGMHSSIHAARLELEVQRQILDKLGSLPERVYFNKGL